MPPPPKKKGVTKWNLEGPVNSGYLAHCSHPFFMSIYIEFSAPGVLLYAKVITK